MNYNQTTPNWPGVSEDHRRIEHDQSQEINNEALGASSTPAQEEDLFFNAAQSIWPYEEEGSIQR